MQFLSTRTPRETSDSNGNDLTGAACDDGVHLAGMEKNSCQRRDIERPEGRAHDRARVRVLEGTQPEHQSSSPRGEMGDVRDHLRETTTDGRLYSHVTNQCMTRDRKLDDRVSVDSRGVSLIFAWCMEQVGVTRRRCLLVILLTDRSRWMTTATDSPDTKHNRDATCLVSLGRFQSHKKWSLAGKRAERNTAYGGRAATGGKHRMPSVNGQINWSFWMQ
ncbi:hypothetical protein DE146DRAFT_634261 [Phaeosphaeria sp. MPI-PUGE-AT-0046c]|nr:hypothetical protein DE146DRAFT_634261 [Phaeosphaeria sp. MPI-PUGE-AT-0046c]